LEPVGKGAVSQKSVNVRLATAASAVRSVKLERGE